uniref:Uncharacterized protein n=1 Tax=Pristionchus pacificus TaxID=54126 RepID=A0A2A6D370_PRIPA|eukprot:PDM84731.1 hypothetical protein PRIPAC_33754 [Pristionchus pacificus]
MENGVRESGRLRARRKQNRKINDSRIQKHPRSPYAKSTYGREEEEDDWGMGMKSSQESLFATKAGRREGKDEEANMESMQTRNEKTSYMKDDRALIGEIGEKRRGK